MGLRSLVACLIAGFVAFGCSGFKEPPSTVDADPPPGYNPLFVRSIAPLPAQKPASLSMKATRIERTSGKTIRVYMHLVDSTGTYYYGASQGAFRSLWCSIVEQVGSERSDVKKYTLKEVTERDREPTAVALVMDNSGSMGDPRARAVQDAAEMFARKKAPEDAMAFVRYDEHAVVESALTTNVDTLLAHLQKNGLEGFGGGTAIHSGIGAAIDHLNATAGSFNRKAVVVFTDGQENSSKISKDSAILMAQKYGITVCAVDFGAGINEGYMESISKPTGGSYSHIYRTSEFPLMFEDVYRRIKNFYVLEYTPDEYGVHTVNVKLCFPKDTVQSSFTYDNTPDVGSIALLNVFFDNNKSTLQAESKRALNNVVTLMKVYPNMTIEVRGHTDNSNKSTDVNYNTTLSQKRADAVRDALVKTGIDSKRITSKGFGDAQPVAPNTTEEGKAQNRRTEFIVISR